MSRPGNAFAVTQKRELCIVARAVVGGETVEVAEPDEPNIARAVRHGDLAAGDLPMIPGDRHVAKSRVRIARRRADFRCDYGVDGCCLGHRRRATERGGRGNRGHGRRGAGDDAQRTGALAVWRRSEPPHRQAHDQRNQCNKAHQKPSRWGHGVVPRDVACHDRLTDHGLTACSCPAIAPFAIPPLSIVRQTQMQFLSHRGCKAILYHNNLNR